MTESHAPEILRRATRALSTLSRDQATAVESSYRRIRGEHYRTGYLKAFLAIRDSHPELVEGWRVAARSGAAADQGAYSFISDKLQRRSRMKTLAGRILWLAPGAGLLVVAAIIFAFEQGNQSSMTAFYAVLGAAGMVVPAGFVGTYFFQSPGWGVPHPNEVLENIWDAATIAVAADILARSGVTGISEEIAVLRSPWIQAGLSLGILDLAESSQQP
ncbi:MAG TPA: hypothetical protein VF885_06925 [Arthrobacter sp.]